MTVLQPRLRRLGEPGGLDASLLRFLLRDHALILEPGELLVVIAPPSWLPAEVRDLHDALNTVLVEHGLAAVVTPGTAVAVGQQVAVVRDITPAG